MHKIDSQPPSQVFTPYPSVVFCDRILTITALVLGITALLAWSALPGLNTLHPYSFHLALASISTLLLSKMCFCTKKVNPLSVLPKKVEFDEEADKLYFKGRALIHEEHAERALSYLFVAAEKGHIEAHRSLAFLFERGSGVLKLNYDQAIYHHQFCAAQENDLVALLSLAILFLKKNEPDEALKYVKEAAKINHNYAALVETYEMDTTKTARVPLEAKLLLYRDQLFMREMQEIINVALKERTDS